MSLLPLLLMLRICNNTEKQHTHDIFWYFGGTYIIINIGRKWNDELEETITTLQQFLEEQCDAYFVDIKQRAVKVPACYIIKLNHLSYYLTSRVRKCIRVLGEPRNQDMSTLHHLLQPLHHLRVKLYVLDFKLLSV